MPQTLPEPAALLIDHLVRLSSFRERDPLLRTLTQGVLDVACAEQVTIFALITDKQHRYWVARTGADRHNGFAVLTDPLHIDSSTMQPADNEPLRLRCVEQVEIVRTPADVQARSGPHAELCVARFPVLLTGTLEAWGVVEITSATTLTHTAVLGVTRLINVFCNMLSMLDYSECDALTGLWNRKSFDDMFYKTMPASDSGSALLPVAEHRHTQNANSFWLAMCDIDHFKQVNDRFGHLIGDEVLLLVARLLKVAFRVHDRVYRFGGEEFVVVLRCATHEAAAGALERFRASMEHFDFPQAGRITVSVGFTQIVAGDSPNAACERADQAVYHAKHNGRNQVCSEADLVERGLLKSDAKIGGIELF